MVKPKRLDRILAASFYIIMGRAAVIKCPFNNPGKFLDRKTYRLMLEAGLGLLAGGSAVGDYLRRLIPGGNVGIKLNCLTPFNPTMKPLAEALADILIDAGGRENHNLVFWERSNRELKNAGYDLNASSFGRRVMGTDTNGVGYDDSFFSSGRVSSMVTRVLTDLVEHSINLPVLKDHSIAGLSAGMKNMYGAIHNPNKYHGGNCSPYAADINNLEPIRAKHRLTIVDAVRIQYDRGPGFDDDSLAWYNGLILSEDPVAADRVALEILEHVRAQNGKPPLNQAGRPVNYLFAAEQLGMGQSHLERIDLKVSALDAQGRLTPTELW